MAPSDVKFRISFCDSNRILSSSLTIRNILFRFRTFGSVPRPILKEISSFNQADLIKCQEIADWRIQAEIPTSILNLITCLKANESSFDEFSRKLEDNDGRDDSIDWFGRDKPVLKLLLSRREEPTVSSRIFLDFIFRHLVVESAVQVYTVLKDGINDIDYDLDSEHLIPFLARMSPADRRFNPEDPFARFETDERPTSHLYHPRKFEPRATPITPS